jgi:hypothetical protein
MVSLAALAINLGMPRQRGGVEPTGDSELVGQEGH